MRTRMIARWRRAALGGALALLLAVPLRAQQDGPPPPAPPQATEPQAAQPQRRQSPQVLEVPPEDTPRPRAKSAPITEQSPRPPPDDCLKPGPGAPQQYTIPKADRRWHPSQKLRGNPSHSPKHWRRHP